VHSKCIQNRMCVSQKSVRLLLVLYLWGVQARLRRKLRRRQYVSDGPNATWHIDGYDKLKPLGICIHGCIDGFSRQIIWMEAYNTNNNQTVIAGYFLSAWMHKRVKVKLKIHMLNSSRYSSEAWTWTVIWVNTALFLERVQPTNASNGSGFA
jgi:hypothetical protein